MERIGGLWRFKEKSADRLWHKSAIGKPAEGGGLHMNTVELLFCVNHRNIEYPKARIIVEELKENPNFLVQYAAMEALRIPGNKVVLNIDQWSSEYDFEKNSWAMRWPSNLHPRESSPISELQIFNSNDAIFPEELYSWCQEVEHKGLIPEIIVVDEEGSAVTYRISIEDPRGELGEFSEIDIDLDSLYEISSGGYFVPNLDNVDSRVSEKLLGGAITNSAFRSLINGVEDTRSMVLLDLLNRGLNPKSGFKYGTKWRCYEGNVGESHAPWLVADPENIPSDWNEACLASRLASGVNKKWLMPIIKDSEIYYASISRPPTDSRWSTPR